MARDWIFLSKEQDKTRMSMFISSSQQWAVRQGEQIKGIQSRVKEVKQSLFTEDISVYVKKNMIECAIQQLELGGRFTSVAGYKLLLLSCFSRVQLCATPWTTAYQAPPSMGFSRQEY